MASRIVALVVSAILVLLIGVEAVQYPDLRDFKKGLQNNANKCANVHHVQWLQVLAVMEAPARVGYDRNSKCFICCMMEKYQMLTPDGEFLDGNMRKIASDLPESQFRDVVNKHLDTCLREDNDDICEKCYQFAQCYYSRAKTIRGNQRNAGRRGYTSNYYDNYNKYGISQSRSQAALKAWG